MGVANKIKIMCVVKNVSKTELAKELDMIPHSFYNKLSRDTMSYKDAEKIADILGFDIVFKDRETGKEY